jgi:hypothetical protein
MFSALTLCPAEYAAVILSLVHTIGLQIRALGQAPWSYTWSTNKHYSTGYEALAPLAILCIFSLPQLRRKWYEAFFVVHFLAAAFFVWLMCNHGPCVWFPPRRSDRTDVNSSYEVPRIPVLLLRRHSSLVGRRSLAARRCPVRPRTAHGSGTRSTPCDVRNDARRAHQGCSADQHELAAWSTHLPPSA